VFGTSTLIGSTATFVIVPGLTQTVTVPANSVLYISTDGGILTTSTAATGFSIVDVVIFVDGAVISDASFHRVIAANTTGIVTMIEYWSAANVRTLSAGSHTIDVRAAFAGGSAAAQVSGDASSVLQGQLSVVILKK
jgi:hypothetical protein